MHLNVIKFISGNKLKNCDKNNFIAFYTICQPILTPYYCLQSNKMTNLRDTFARNLKANRQKCGFTQAQLAEKVGVSTHHIAMIEIARHYPTLELVERIANTLGIEIYELFIVKSSPENAMERLHDTLVSNIEKVVAEAIEKNLNEKCKGKG